MIHMAPEVKPIRQITTAIERKATTQKRKKEAEYPLRDVTPFLTRALYYLMRVSAILLFM